MQENKTLNKILTIAQTEFLEKGFRGASLREIVKKAGVTTGAFYGYFKSKEDLFAALVKEHYEYILGVYDSILCDFKKLSIEDQITHMDDYSSIGFKKMFEYVWDHKLAFKIILKSSEGTKYENFLDEIARKDINATNEFCQILEEKGRSVERIELLIEQIVISGTFSSFFSLILRDIPKDQAEKGLFQMFQFYRGGWNCLMHFDNQ